MVTQSEAITAIPAMDDLPENTIDLSVLMEEMRENIFFLFFFDFIA
jgi:hypothetical protein